MKKIFQPGHWKYLVLLAVVTFTNPAGASNTPTLRLFTPNTIESLAESTKAASSLEGDLRPVVTSLERSHRLFSESLCAGGSGVDQGLPKDPGCAQLQRGLVNGYQEMLRLMRAGLPEIKQSVQSTHQQLQTSFAQWGSNLTPAQVQSALSGKKSTRKSRGKKRIAQTFAHYHRLVASKADSPSQLAVDLLHDTAETLEIIEQIEAEVASAEISLAVMDAYGVVEPQMIAVVDAAKSILFGEGHSLALPVPIAEPVTERSSWVISH